MEKCIPEKHLEEVQMPDDLFYPHFSSGDELEPEEEVRRGRTSSRNDDESSDDLYIPHFSSSDDSDSEKFVPNCSERSTLSKTKKRVIKTGQVTDVVVNTTPTELRHKVTRRHGPIFRRTHKGLTYDQCEGAYDWMLNLRNGRSSMKPDDPVGRPNKHCIQQTIDLRKWPWFQFDFYQRSTAPASKLWPPLNLDQLNHLNKIMVERMEHYETHVDWLQNLQTDKLLVVPSNS